MCTPKTTRNTSTCNVCQLWDIERHLETEQAKILTNQTLKIDPKKSFWQVSPRGLNRSFTVDPISYRFHSTLVVITNVIPINLIAPACACACACVCACACTCACACMDACACVCAHVYACARANVRSCACARVHARVRVCMRARVYGLWATSLVLEYI